MNLGPSPKALAQILPGQYTIINGLIPSLLCLGLSLLFPLIWSDANAGAVGIRCNDPVVFSNSDVNIGVIPFTTEAPDADLTYQSNTFVSSSHLPASKLARVIQLDTLFSLRYPAGMGVVHFQGAPEDCQPEAVIQRIMASHESITLKAGKGMIMFWGRFLGAGDDLYAQSYLSFFRRGAKETVKITLGSGTDASSFFTGVGRQAIPFASRRLSGEELQAIELGFDRASIIWENAEGLKRVGQLPEHPEQPFAFSVSEVNAKSGRMRINPYRYAGIPDGWIDARVDPESWPLRAQLPELNFLNALAGYLAFRVIEGERPDPNWAGRWPRRLLSLRERAAGAFRTYRNYAVLPADSGDGDATAMQMASFEVDASPLQWLSSGPRNDDAKFIIPASERSALAWSHSLVALMDLITSTIEEIESEQREQAIRRARSQIERAEAYVPNDANLLNLAALIELRACCKDGVFDRAGSEKSILRADEYWRKALAADPGHRNTIRNLAQLYSAFENSGSNALGLSTNQVSKRLNTVINLEKRTRQAFIASVEPVATIYFPSGSRIDPAARGEIERVVALYREYGANRIELNGYSDPSGAAEANLALSSKRVRAVTRALYDYGLSAENIAGTGHGENDPKGDAENLTAQSRRRVEVYLR